MLKLLGERADSLPGHVDSAMAVSPPVDLAACSEHLRTKARAYDRYFARLLYRRWQERREQAPHAAAGQLERAPRCLLEFDEAYTAPLWGYPSVEEYYSDASSARWLSQISVPTQMILADDDPVIPLSAMEKAKRMSSRVAGK